LRGKHTRLGRDWFFNDIFFFRELIFFEGSFVIFFFTRAFLPAPVLGDFVFSAFVLSGFLVDVFSLEAFRTRAGLMTGLSFIGPG